MKPNFYIFLDIDGVMFDWEYIKSCERSREILKLHIFNPKSVEALNYLMKEMGKQYNVNLVISSIWRLFMKETEEVFKKNNICYPNKLTCTPHFYDPHERGGEIMQYLKNVNFNKNKDDYLIIDDETFDFDKYFPKSKFIKTNIFNASLSMEMVQKYLSQKNNTYQK